MRNNPGKKLFFFTFISFGLVRQDVGKLKTYNTSAVAVALKDDKTFICSEIQYWRKTSIIQLYKACYKEMLTLSTCYT